MVVGVVLAGALQHNLDLSAAGALAVSLDIAIQNVSKSAMASVPQCAVGNSRWRSSLLGGLSRKVEPIGDSLIILLAEALTREASIGEHSNLGTIGFAISFVLMMVLDVLMG